ncbi:MAG: hypothetical protein QF662_06635, partial [Phycisphaerae bacterium]|nr:hypothetical protein [Phycisphaerae bacterium]
MQRSDGRSTRYSVLSRFYVISIIAHMFLALLALLIYLPVIEPPPVEIEIDLAAGAQLLDSAIAEGKMALLINQLESYDKTLAEVEAAEKALKEALGQYGEELVEDFAGDFEIGGDTDPGFDSGLSFQTGQELVELGKEAVEPLLDSLDNLEDDSKTRRRTAKVLAMLGEKRAIPTLVERFAAGDKAFWGIQLAMNKLAADDPKNAKVIGNELIRRTKDPEQMAKMAKNWLFVGATTVGGKKKYEKQIERFLIDGDKKTRDAWFSMAPHFGTLRKNTQRTLARLLLYDEDEDTRLQAATAIGYSGWDVEVVDELKRAFKTDKSVKVRSALLRTLNATAQDDRTAINIEATKDSSS